MTPTTMSDKAVVANFVQRLDAGEMVNVELRKLTYPQLLILARKLAGDDSTTHVLTVREREVLALIASGKSSKQIAADFGIAFNTVVCHRYHIQTKLNAHNIADLTRAAMRMGLVEP